MDEKKKGVGRPTIYTGRENGYVKSERTERKLQEQKQAGVLQGKRQRGTEPEQAGVPRRRQRGTEPEQADVPKKKRHREMETEARMRVLWSILGVLVAILIAAIIYEVVLGYGTKETGAERMEKMRQEKLLKVPESEDGRGTEASEEETEAGEPNSEAGGETEAR